MEQDVIFGKNAFDAIADSFLFRQSNSTLIICGKNVCKQHNIMSRMQKIASYQNLHFFQDFSPNPQLEDALNGATIAKNVNADLIICIGGGSAIDMGKSIKALASDNHNPESTTFENITPASIPIIAVPTTSGSGSEATSFAVIYINKIKHSIEHSSLRPELAIIDYNLQFSMTQYLAACSGFDALAHAIESYWGVKSNDISDTYAMDALILIASNIRNAVLTDSETAKISMSIASYKSGQAINITKTTAPHAFSYFFTSNYNLPHGHALALTLPFFFKYNYGVTHEDNNDIRGEEFVRSKISKIMKVLNIQGEMAIFPYFSSLLNSIKINTNLNTLGINIFDIMQNITSQINEERLYNNPRLFEKNTAITLLKQLY